MFKSNNNNKGLEKTAYDIAKKQGALSCSLLSHIVRFLTRVSVFGIDELLPDQRNRCRSCTRLRGQEISAREV